MSKKKARRAAKRKLKALKKAGDVKGVFEVLGLAAVAFAAGVIGAASKQRLLHAGEAIVTRVRHWRRDRVMTDANGLASMEASAR